MRRTSIRVAAVAVAAGAVLLLAGLASAVTISTDTPFAVTCTSTGQQCSPAYQQTVTTSSRLDLEFTSVFSGCADFSVTFSVDGKLVFTSGLLTPGASTGTFVAGPVAPGPHTLAVQATGTTSGCDTGTLTAWGGRFAVTTNDDPATPTPTVAPPPLPPPVGPTSAGQCKKGGWATFVNPRFRNQGACVSYVEHLRDHRGEGHRGGADYGGQREGRD
jgi:hypothetical protein